MQRSNHVNYTLRKARTALHFILRILKKGNNTIKPLAFTALVRSILWSGVFGPTQRRLGKRFKSGAKGNG
jgi:hypothetical protein